MKPILRVAALLQLFLWLSGLCFGQAISAPSSATTPATLPAGSYTKITLAPGPNTLTIDINGTYTGQFAVQCAYQGSTGPLRTWPAASITNSLTPGSTGISANATGTWTCTVPGPGSAYLVATTLASGAPTVFLSAGSGVGGASAAADGASSLGTYFDATAPISGGTPVNALGVGVTTGTDCKRVDICVNSVDYGVWVKLTRTNVAPTITAASKLVRIYPNDTKSLKVLGSGWYVWVISESPTFTVPTSTQEYR